MKKKILILGPLEPTIGGITTYINGILKSDLQKKYDIMTFGTHRPTFGILKTRTDYSVIFEIGLKTLIKSVLVTLSNLVTFPFILLKKNPDLIHIHTSSYWSYWENAVYLIMSRIFFKKTLLHIHGSKFDVFVNNSNKGIKKIISKTINLADKVIVLSQKWKGVFLGIIDEDKITVLENFVKLSRFTRSNKLLDPSNDIIKILFMGGVSAKRKGLYDILKAIPIATKKHKNIIFNLTIVGNTDNIMETCKKKNIIPYINIRDYIPESKKIDMLLNHDIFLLPSYAEGMPISILEAMAAGLPMVTTSVGSIPEVIEDNINGFLIEPGDYHSLAKKIVQLAKDEELRQKMRIANIYKIEKQFDMPVIMKKLDKLYSLLLVQ